jgi:hypothetical protein
MAARRFIPLAPSLSLVAAATLLIGGLGLGVKAAQEKATDQKPLKVSAVELSKAYNTDTTKADDKYAKKLLVIDGTVLEAFTAAGIVYVSLSGFNEKDGQPRVVCVMKEGSKEASFKQGSKVTIKGTCAGALGVGNVEVKDCALAK